MAFDRKLKIDKSDWGAGSWQTEPDRVDFVHAGFACLALRNPRLGFWCGYVGVPADHPAYGRKYDDMDVEVHGGLTYSNACSEPVCHMPEPGMPADVWWLGFDCAHLFDVSPGQVAIENALGMPRMPSSAILPETVYRDLEYVQAEIKSLAEQLRLMACRTPVSPV